MRFLATIQSYCFDGAGLGGGLCADRARRAPLTGAAQRAGAEARLSYCTPVRCFQPHSQAILPLNLLQDKVTEIHTCLR